MNIIKSHWIQVYWNYKRKSTVGWSIFNILLDLTGGTFSVAQNMLNVLQKGKGILIIQADKIFIGWTQLNPAKFFLGNVSILFDIIFIIQHYILYPLPKLTKKGNVIQFVELPEKTRWILQFWSYFRWKKLT